MLRRVGRVSTLCLRSTSAALQDISGPRDRSRPDRRGARQRCVGSPPLQRPPLRAAPRPTLGHGAPRPPSRPRLAELVIHGHPPPPESALSYSPRHLSQQPVVHARRASAVPSIVGCPAAVRSPVVPPA